MLVRSVFIVVASGLMVPFATQTQQPVPVKFWADKSTDVSGRVSRNGRILPFVDWTTYGLSVRALIISGAVGEEQGIWRVPLNGAPPQRLKLDVAGVTEARLSPDGRAVAYTTQPTRGRELWVLRGAVSAGEGPRAP